MDWIDEVDHAIAFGKCYCVMCANARESKKISFKKEVAKEIAREVAKGILKELSKE